MGKKKLILLLRAMSAADLRHFQRHLKNTAGERTQVHKALGYLLRHHPDLADEALAHKHISHHVFGGRSVDGKRLSNLFSELYGELKSFLIAEHLKKDARLETRIMLEVLRERRLKELFGQTIEGELQPGNAAAAEDMWLHLWRFELHYLRYFMPEQTLRGNDSLLSAIGQLDAFHHLAFLKIACELVNRRNILGEPLPPGIGEAVRRLAVSPAAGPASNAYRQVFDLLNHGQPDLFFAIRDEFLPNSRQFSPEDRQAVLRYLINYASRRMRGGDLAFLSETFNLLRFGLDSKLLPNFDDISANVFLNTLELALSLREFDWAESFAAGFLPRVRPRERGQSEQLARVYRQYYHGRPDEARRLLATVVPDDPFFKIRVKVLLIQLCYDQQEHDLLPATLNTFNQLLRRESQLGGEITRAYANFAKMVRLMMKNRNGRPDQLRQRLENMRPIIYKKWLSERIGQQLVLK